MIIDAYAPILGVYALYSELVKASAEKEAGLPGAARSRARSGL
jgi:hypothetical protein